MQTRADLALYDRDGQLAAIVEIKNKRGTSREWATQLRRNILAHGGFRNTDFFLLVTPDRLYLWKGPNIEPTLVQPDYETDACPFLQPYFESAKVDPETISSPAFGLLVSVWLADLARSEQPPTKPIHERTWLEESGFLAAVRNGRIEYEAAA